ncbi:MAG: FtsX-like permease family protein [Bacteroidota bacterium]
MMTCSEWDGSSPHLPCWPSLLPASGCFALSAFMVEQRSKEISIRLVLGASLQSIFNLLTLNFLKLVLISVVLATPIAWYMMKSWLEDFYVPHRYYVGHFCARGFTGNSDRVTNDQLSVGEGGVDESGGSLKSE